MEEKDKQLLLKDLCARLPYGVKVELTKYKKKCLLCGIDGEDLYLNIDYPVYLGDSIKPYLRSMSSMTEEEVKEFYDVECIDAKVGYIKPTWNWHFTINGIDWLNAHYFDYRGLIPKGLAIEVTEKKK